MKKIMILIPALNKKVLVMKTLKSLEKNLVFEVPNINIKILGISNDGTNESVKQRYGKAIEFSLYKDRGIYDALGQELSKLTNTYVTWLGAGDIWLDDALKVINKMINLNSNWFMGLPTLIDHDWNIKQIYPFRTYKKKLIYQGFHNGRYLPFIQQESTVWNSLLHSKVDWDYFRELKYAGDYYLWKKFSEIIPLQSINNHIGAYLLHDDSLSRNNYESYLKEIEEFTEKTAIGHILAVKEKQKLFRAKYFSKTKTT